MPALSNIMMIGDNRKYNTFLVTLKTQANEDGSFSDILINEAADVNPDVKTVSEAIKDNKWDEYITNGIKQYNNSKIKISQAQSIQKFYICPVDFSIPGGELGPTLKLNRYKVVEKYSNEIDRL